MDRRSKSPSQMSEHSMGKPENFKEADSSSSKSPAQMSESSMGKAMHRRRTDSTRSKSPDALSESSMDKIINLRWDDNISLKSPAQMSESSMGKAMHRRRTDSTRSKSPDVLSESSMDKIINIRWDDNIRSKSPDLLSESSMDKILNIREADNISSASYADSGISEPNFRTPEQRQSLQYARPEDVACDLCEGRKLKACKSCMTCAASFCEIHIQDHYRKEALKRHLLVEVTKSLDILQENARLKKSIEKEREEKQILKKENETLKQVNETLKQKIGELRLPEYIRQEKTPEAVNVTLDPETAHCALSLSHDKKRVRHGERRNVHHCEQRFDKWECVLGSEGFSSGKHYWEVKVNREFTVGVIRHSAQRKGKFTFSPSEGYWCLYHFRQAFTALDDPSKNLPIDTVPQVLGVCVDVDKKWVTFYNAETKAHIYTFRDMNTCGEKIYPLFSTLSKSMDLEIMTVRWDTLL